MNHQGEPNKAIICLLHYFYTAFQPCQECSSVCDLKTFDLKFIEVLKYLLFEPVSKLV